MKELDKHFNYSEVEPRIYELWEKSGFFSPETCVKKGICKKNAPVFSMVLPPPNVTGVLHIGHAFEDTLQDIMVRYARMRGKRTLWVPGTDHAAIATQARVEKDIYNKEKITRHDLGREEFLKRVIEFTKQSHYTIVKQIKALGASLDWKREAYTLDAKREIAVYTAFKRMYDDGLIYEGERVVNWDPKLQTTVSDDEVEYKEEKSVLYYIKYGPLEVATVRPETIFGDTAVAVHPKDKRYKKYIGKEVEVDFLIEKRKVKVIGDKYVKQEFGTGALKVTPAHDSNDFEVWLRHKKEIEGPKQVINEYGKMNHLAGKYEGLKTKEARIQVVKDLKSKGLLIKIDENYIHNIATNSREGGIIEPLLKKQWFINVDKEFILPYSNLKEIKTGQKITLKKLMQSVVKSGEIEILPIQFKKVYFHWINNLHDWCISRQIWWGHRLPVWYHELKCIPRKGREKDVEKCEETIVSIVEPKCKYCDAKYIQAEDTLDTWFSSSLWTFSTLGWPLDYVGGKLKKGSDLNIYHPTTMMAPGYEILFFWVARMILMSTYLLGEIPFKTVLLHGMVRDEQGRKFSKSLGNGIDPIELVKEYGADALRMSLIAGSTPGRDLPFSQDRTRGYRNFATKLWNITRFLLMNLGGYQEGARASFTQKDNKIYTEFENVIKKVTQDMEKYRYSQAAEKIYQYAWHTFADKILENSKSIFGSKNKKMRASRQKLLLEIWADTLTMLHPFMPFVTEELYSYLPTKNKKLLMIRKWPNS